MKKNFGFVLAAAILLAGWRTEKRNDNDNCTSRKDYDCRVKIDYQKRFLGNRGSGGICEAGFPGQTDKSSSFLSSKDRK